MFACAQGGRIRRSDLAAGSATSHQGQAVQQQARGQGQASEHRNPARLGTGQSTPRAYTTHNIGPTSGIEGRLHDAQRTTSGPSTRPHGHRTGPHDNDGKGKQHTIVTLKGKDKLWRTTTQRCLEQDNPRQGARNSQHRPHFGDRRAP